MSDTLDAADTACPGPLPLEPFAPDWLPGAAPLRTILADALQPGVTHVAVHDHTGRLRAGAPDDEGGCPGGPGAVARAQAQAQVPVVVAGTVVATVHVTGAAEATAAVRAAARHSAARLADAAVAAQEIDSLSGEVLRAYEELHLLYALGDALTGQLTVAEVADLILEHVLNALPAAWAELRLAEAQAPIQIRRDHAVWATGGARGGGEQRLSAALRSGGQTVGSILLVRPHAAAPFTAGNGKLLDAVGAFAGSAIRNAQLRQQVDTDPLTGLLNHRALLEHLDTAVDRGAPFALLLLDVDNFKLFNDTYGHPVGDGVLSQTAATLRALCRAGDAAGRYGGDEFALLLRDAGAAEAREVVARLHAAVRARPYVTGSGAVIPLTLSVGLACLPGDGSTRRALMAVADDAMYADKRRRMAASPRAADGTDGSVWARMHLRGAAELLGHNPLGVLDGLVTAVDSKDRYTREHSEDVAHLALLLAEELALAPEQQRVLAVAGLLHDVGKIAVPDHILRKPGALTEDEHAVIRRHVAYGVAFIRGVLDDTAVVDAVAYHHERWDGRGYPHGVDGAATPLLGRIMQVADAVSAMMLDRPYRQGMPWGHVVAVLRAGAGAQFDPALVEPFIAAMESSPWGQRRAAPHPRDHRVTTAVSRECTRECPEKETDHA